MSADEELSSRRFRLYDETAPLLVRAGDTTAGPAERLDAGRKAAVRLREWPVYLTPETLAALSDLESALDDAARLAVAATVLHSRLAEALRSVVWAEPAESLRLESAHRERLSLQEDRMRREREAAVRSEQAQVLWRRGAEELAAGKGRKAVRSLQEAAALEPERPALLNDLGLALAAAGEDRLAVVEYRKAVELSDARPERRSPGWALTLYNLAKALRRLAEAVDKAGQFQESADRLREAQEAVRRFLREGHDPARTPQAQDLLSVIEKELARAEKSLRILGVPPAPASVPSPESAS